MRLSKSVRTEISCLFSLDSEIRQEVFKEIEGIVRIYLRISKSYESEKSAKEKRKSLKKLESTLDKTEPLLGGIKNFEQLRNEVIRFQKKFSTEKRRRDDMVFMWLLSELYIIFKSNSKDRITVSYNEDEVHCKGKFPQFIRLCFSPLDAHYKKTESALCEAIKKSRKQRFKNPFQFRKSFKIKK